MRPGVRVVAFVGTVAAISILANFSLELVASKYPNVGLARFTTFTHGTPNPGGS
jgi:hypothetical protein